MPYQRILLPTTQAQVSGHKFFLRRIEHGLVLGDTRMIHDPLARRRRAALFGGVACVLLCLGAGALALFVPRVDPGEAPIVVADTGALYVRIDDRLHPVLNLTSAQLIAGAPEQPARASNEVLAEIPRGVPVGLIDAPGVIDTSDTHRWQFSACAAGDAIEVRVAEQAPTPIEGGEAILAQVAGVTYVVTSQGRQALPPGDTPEGRVVRRRLGISAKTPVWGTSPDMLNTIAEQPEVRIPDGGELWETSDREAYFMRDHAVIRLTNLQRDILLDLGFQSRTVGRDEPTNLADAPSFVDLPTAAPRTWLDPADRYVCATGEEGDIALFDAPPAGVTINPKLSYRGPGLGLPVDTGHGWLVISDHGTRHTIPNEEALAALGIESPTPAPWSIIKLLPEGVALDPVHALVPLGAGS